MLNIVSTPIGNLEDLSIRQAKTLISSDIILAEDTRSARILLDFIKKTFPQLLTANHQLLKIKLISYYKEKEFEKLPEIIKYLKENKNISLISESGTPLISDPGYLLVKTCIKENIPITHIPGSSAVISSIILSGFNPSQFMFLGFLPKKQSQKLQLFNQLKQIKKILPEAVFIFYESAKRINNTLEIILSFKTNEWNPEIVICRELTKKFEEIIRGKAKDLINKKFKGEITILLK